MKAGTTTAARSFMTTSGIAGHRPGKVMALLAGLLLTSMMPPHASAQTVEDWRLEFGTRYWYSTGTARKDLYGPYGAVRVSRLTYDDLDAHAGEGYFRMDYGDTGLFIKGYAGLGTIVGGALRDEDFEPVVSPYSSTDSDQDKGRLAYASIDLGYTVLETNPTDGPSLRLGGFVGYHYYHQKLNAYGCQQTATNDTICTPALPASLKVITQDNDWHSLRLGMALDMQPMDRLRLTLDGAFTYSWLKGKDHHWLRPSINPVPEDGDGLGFQLEGVLAYQVAEGVELGIGGRYWQLGRFDTRAHFEETPGGGITQQEKWKSTRYGVFLQASWRF